MARKKGRKSKQSASFQEFVQKLFARFGEADQEKLRQAARRKDYPGMLKAMNMPEEEFESLAKEGALLAKGVLEAILKAAKKKQV